jgi:2-amino-4-hydroxy-6-hydroxymethyldihydropteridine diphosphokinase
MAGMEEAMLLLGSDRGDPVALCARAEGLIAERVGTVVARSRDHWTEPWGFTDPELFLNRALVVATELPPAALMARLLAIETLLGRVRAAGEGPAPRTIDIDILWMGHRVVQGGIATLPHPRLHQRAFALGPAADLAPDWRHPLLGRTVLEMLDDLRNTPG